MSYAHNHGVIHRDLKPDNIMVGAFDEMIVMDWGTARVEAEDQESDSELVLESDVSLKTMHGSLIGTPRYMSPEQAKGDSDQVNASSDLFALGMILYELIELNPDEPEQSSTTFFHEPWFSRTTLVFRANTSHSSIHHQ